MQRAPNIPLRCLLMLPVWPALTPAQEPTPPPPQPRPATESPKATRAFQPHQVRLEEAADVIHRLYPTVRVAWLERTNSLVVRDATETLDQVAALLADLERQPAAKPETRGANVHALQHRSAEEVADLLLSVFFESKIVADGESNRLIVRGGGEAEVDNIERMIAELDVPHHSPSDTLHARTLSITVDLIQAAQGSQDKGTLPDRLKEVADELARAGWGALRLYAHLKTEAQDGKGFELYHGFSAPAGRQMPPMIRIEGQAELQGVQAEMRIKTNINLPVEGDEHFGLETTATWPLGHDLVLATFPLSTKGAQAMLTTGPDSVLMVVRVTAD